MASEGDQTAVQSTANGSLMLLWFNKAPKQHVLIHWQKHTSLCVQYTFMACVPFIQLLRHHKQASKMKKLQLLQNAVDTAVTMGHMRSA